MKKEKEQLQFKDYGITFICYSKHLLKGNYRNIWNVFYWSKTKKEAEYYNAILEKSNLVNPTVVNVKNLPKEESQNLLHLLYDLYYKRGISTDNGVGVLHYVIQKRTRYHAAKVYGGGINYKH